MRPSWRSCTGFTGPLRARCSVSARKRMDVSGDRRSCATSTTSSSPSGPERRSARWRAQSDSSCAATCSKASSTRSSSRVGRRAPWRHRAKNSLRTSATSRRESTVRGRSAMHSSVLDSTPARGGDAREMRHRLVGRCRILHHLVPVALHRLDRVPKCRPQARRDGRGRRPVRVPCAGGGATARRRSPLGVTAVVSVSGVTRPRRRRSAGTRACP